MKTLLDVKADLERKLQIVNDALALLRETESASVPRNVVVPDASSPIDAGRPEAIRGNRTKASPKAVGEGLGGRVTNAEIRDIVHQMTGEFSASDVATAVRQKFPLKELLKTKVPSVLYELKQDGKLRVMNGHRSGRKGFTYVIE